MKGIVVQIGDRFGSDPNRQTSPLFERGVMLAPVADAVRGFLYPWQEEHAMTPHSRFFTQIHATKPYDQSTFCLSLPAEAQVLL